MTTDDGDDVGISPTKEQRAGRAFSSELRMRVLLHSSVVRWFDHEGVIHPGGMFALLTILDRPGSSCSFFKLVHRLRRTMNLRLLAKCGKSANSEGMTDERPVTSQTDLQYRGGWRICLGDSC